MKTDRAKREKERLAKVKLRYYARRIPDNQALVRILLSFNDLPFRRDFYHKIVPHLKFEPIPLESLQ